MNKERVVILEANIDDMNPELYSYLIERLIKEGAGEAFIQPVVMKKNRIGASLTVVCQEKLKNKLIEKIFAETTTFGIRINRASHVELKKEIKKVKTKYGQINVKIGKFKGKVKTISPEYKDCEKIAKEKNAPIKEIYNEVKRSI